MYFIILNLFLYIYSSYYRRNIKRKFLICGLVQDHHIIPREFRNVINYNSSKLINSIDDSNNLIMMPTNYGKLYLNTQRSIHENGHKHYNRYIFKLISNNYSVDFIIKHVKQQLRTGEITRVI